MPKIQNVALPWLVVDDVTQAYLNALCVTIFEKKENTGGPIQKKDLFCALP